MNIKSYTILPSVGIKTDFQQWNTTQNKYNSKQYKPTKTPPQKLIKAIIKEFEQFCKDHYINADAYSYIEPAQIENEWKQFDFIDNPLNKYPVKIQCHSIVTNKKYQICQRIFDI